MAKTKMNSKPKITVCLTYRQHTLIVRADKWGQSREVQAALMRMLARVIDEECGGAATPPPPAARSS